jgi:hypothetical protein
VLVIQGACLQFAARAPFSFVFDESADPVLQIDSSFRSPPGVLRFRSRVEEAAPAQEFL